MKRIYLSIVFLVILVIQSCSINQILLDNGEISTNNTDSYFVPTPDQLTAVLFGRLYSENSAPIQDGIFLARNISYDSPDLPPTISFSYQNSPRAIVDPDSGFFYFSGVKPAENYVLTIISGPGELFVIKDDEGEIPLMISIQAGDSIDLGTFTVDLP